MALHAGSVLAGRYEITAPIASGGMGEVWQALDRTLGRTVAAKVLRSEYTTDPSFLIRFRNEARHTAALSHPNIASVYDYGESTQDGQRVAYLVMEYVEGKPLVTVLAEQGRLSPARTLDVLEQAGDGLSAAHEAGMVHRDIKPGNLIVRPDGVVKLTDFGIARARDAAPLTRAGMVVGTAQYLSPEQAQGFPVTAASDVYSLGVLGYECLAGARPFDGESQVAIALAQINRPPPPLPPDVPAPVRALIGRALAKDPADRFADGAAFAAAARQVAGGGRLPPQGTRVIPDRGDERTEMLPAVGGTVAGSLTGPRTAPRTMPPLQAPPGDGPDGRYDDRYAGPDHDGGDDDGLPRRRRAGWLWALAALVVLLVVGGVFALVNAGGAARDQTASPSTATSSAAPASTGAVPTGILVDTRAYIGKDADDIEARLTGQQLQVVQKPATQAQLSRLGQNLAPNAVVTTDPTQQPVAAGTLVTLYVAADGWAPGNGSQPTSTNGNGGGTSSGAASSGAASSGGNSGGTRPGTTTTKTATDTATKTATRTATKTPTDTATDTATTTAATKTATGTATDTATRTAPGTPTDTAAEVSAPMGDQG